jgi:homoserine dehydrogenase
MPSIQTIEIDDALLQPPEALAPDIYEIYRSRRGHRDASGIQRRLAAARSAVIPSRSRRPLRIVLLGLGTVGLGVYRHLRARPDLFDVRRVVVRDPSRHFNDGVPHERLLTSVWRGVREPADLVIELIGGVDPAADVVQAALLRGRAVITANKALVAAHWSALRRHAREPRQRLRFSAAVGGAVPVLETLARVRSDSAVTQVRAVINGTCNFVLDEMARGRTLQQAIELAQQHGFAEADPRTDLNGADAAQKLCLIARAAFGLELAPDDVECTGIGHVTPADVARVEQLGARLRLVATCELRAGGISARVRPERLDAGDYLAGARGEENRVEISTSSGEIVRLAGKGAGRWPTALAVMGDVFDLLEDELALHQAIVAWK